MLKDLNKLILLLDNLQGILTPMAPSPIIVTTKLFALFSELLFKKAQLLLKNYLFIDNKKSNVLDCKFTLLLTSSPNTTANISVTPELAYSSNILYA